MAVHGFPRFNASPEAVVRCEMVRGVVVRGVRSDVVRGVVVRGVRSDVVRCVVVRGVE